MKQAFYASGTQWRAHNQKATLDPEEETEIKLNYGTFRNNTWQTFSVQGPVMNIQALQAILSLLQLYYSAVFCKSSCW